MSFREQAKQSLLQNKRYTCGACGAKLTHKEAREHWERRCPAKARQKTS